MNVWGYICFNRRTLRDAKTLYKCDRLLTDEVKWNLFLLGFNKPRDVEARLVHPLLRMCFKFKESDTEAVKESDDVNKVCL